LAAVVVVETMKAAAAAPVDLLKIHRFLLLKVQLWRLPLAQEALVL
jgi:hypothetical protein